MLVYGTHISQLTRCGWVGERKLQPAGSTAPLEVPPRWSERGIPWVYTGGDPTSCRVLGGLPVLAVHVLDMAPHGLREGSRSLGYACFLGYLDDETRHVS